MDAAHPALDEMDRGEVVPGDTELPLRLLVIPEELVDRLGLDDLPFRKVLRNGTIQEAQLLARLKARVDGGARLLGKRREDGRLPVGEILKPAVSELLEVPHPFKVRGAQIRVPDRALHHDELGRELCLVVGRGRQLVPLRLRARRRKGNGRGARCWRCRGVGDGRHGRGGRKAGLGGGETRARPRAGDEARTEDKGDKASDNGERPGSDDEKCVGTAPSGKGPQADVLATERRSAVSDRRRVSRSASYLCTEPTSLRTLDRYGLACAKLRELKPRPPGAVGALRACGRRR